MSMKINVLYEDNHILILNKSSGIPVQKDSSNDISLYEIAKLYIKKKYQKKNNVFLGLVHRIDRPVSGCVTFAKTSKSLKRLNEMFKKNLIKKTYLAIVCGVNLKKSETLEHWLLKKPKINKSFAFLKHVEKSKKACLQYENMFSFENYTLLKIDLKTGRHHQIRTQLSKIGHPIKGDLKYGSKRSNKNKSISLHSSSIELIHPVKKNKLFIKANLPKDDLWSALPSCLDV